MIRKPYALTEVNHRSVVRLIIAFIYPRIEVLRYLCPVQEDFETFLIHKSDDLVDEHLCYASSLVAFMHANDVQVWQSC